MKVIHRKMGRKSCLWSTKNQYLKYNKENYRTNNSYFQSFTYQPEQNTKIAAKDMMSRKWQSDLGFCDPFELSIGKHSSSSVDQTYLLHQSIFLTLYKSSWLKYTKWNLKSNLQHSTLFGFLLMIVVMLGKVFTECFQNSVALFWFDRVYHVHGNYFNSNIRKILYNVCSNIYILIEPTNAAMSILLIQVKS